MPPGFSDSLKAKFALPRSDGARTAEAATLAGDIISSYVRVHAEPLFSHKKHYDGLARVFSGAGLGELDRGGAKSRA